ncbi:diguanylate cyclase [Nguyenibacter vanlangensis]|uniref:diguanylate cyclase n=2 Tax=Nguyenibacter vanlangensis TaxID=1216886 RepID=A0ABZ3D4H9_9PROT
MSFLLKNKYFQPLAIVFGCLLALSAARPARSQTIAATRYGMAAGLTNTAVLSALQLPNGEMLVGTQHGFFAFDGRQFLPLGPEQGLPVGGMAQAAVMTTGGDLVLVLLDRIYVAHAVTEDMPVLGLHFVPVAAHAALSRDEFRKIAPWRGGLVMTDRDRLLFLHRVGGEDRIDTLESALGLAEGTLTDVSALHAERDRLWLGTGGGRLCVLAGRSLHCLPVPALAPPRRVDAIAEDGRGVLYARTLRSLITADPARGTLRVEPVPHIGTQYENYQRFLTIAWTPDGRLMTQADDGELAIRTDDGWTMRMLDGEPIAAPLSVVLFDRQRNLWIGVPGIGMILTRGFGVFENFDRRNGLSGAIIWQMLRRPGGLLWITSDSGIDALDTAARRVVRAIPQAAFLIAADDRGRLWHDGPDYLARMDPATGLQQNYDMRRINKILPGREHDMWILSDTGAWRVDTARADTTPVPVPGMGGAYASGLIDRDGALWLIEGRRLLVRRRNGIVTVARAGWPKADFIPNLLAAQDAHTLWVTGQGGLYRATHDGDRITALTAFGPSEIGTDMTYAVLVDHRGWVWIGSDHGLALFDGAHWTRVTAADGLIADDLDQDSLIEDTDGTIWVGTSRGLSHILRPEQLRRAETLRPVISRMTLGDVPYDGRAVAFSRAPFRVTFGALDYRDEGRIRFRYRLEGVDEGWNEATEDTVRYPSLPPGTHRFLLQAYDPGRDQEPAIVAVSLGMGRPWWQSPEVRIGEIMACGLAGYGLWRIRVGLLIKQRRKLRETVERQTAEIRAAHEALVRQSRLDSLTGLLNRGAIQAHLQACLQADAPGADLAIGLAIGLADVDHFKAINDQMGHLAGDEVLTEIGRRLRLGRRHGEEVGRYGGEEFLIVLQGDGDKAARMEDIRRSLSRAVALSSGRTRRVTVSAGLAEARPGETWQALIGRADAALYRAKKAGRNRMETELEPEPADQSN